MSNFASRARAFGAKEHVGGICLPAAQLVDFLLSEIELGHDVLYFECLYLHEPAGTEPAMELSFELERAGSMSNLLMRAQACAPLAMARAAAKNASAYFEVAEG